MSKKWFIIAIVFFVLIMASAFYFHFWGQSRMQRGGSVGHTPMEMAKQRAQDRMENSANYRSSNNYVVYSNATSLLTYIKYLFLLLVIILVLLYFTGYKKIPNFLMSKIPRKIKIIVGVIIGIAFFMVLGSISGVLTSISNGISLITGNRSNTNSMVNRNDSVDKKNKDHSEKVVTSHSSLQQKMKSSRTNDKVVNPKKRLSISSLESGSNSFIADKINPGKTTEKSISDLNNVNKSEQLQDSNMDVQITNTISSNIEQGMVRIPMVDLHSINSIGKLSNLVKQIIRSQIPGKVAGVLVEEGQYVKKGQPVVVLDTVGYKDNLDNAGIELKKVRLDYSKVMKNYKSVDSAAMWKLQNKMKELQAMILANEAYIRESTIVAQQAGMVTSVNIVKGGFIEPNKPLLVISDPVGLEVTYLIPAEYYRKIKLNTVTYLTLKKGSPYGYVAIVNYIAPDIDMKTNMLIVQATIKNRSALLKDGMAVYVLQTVKE